jgi:hypothetical protein
MGRHAADGMDEALGWLLLPYCCQDPSSMIVGSSLFIGFAGKIESRRADTNRLPLLITSKAVPYSEPAKNGRQVLLNLLCPLRIRQYR